MEASTDLDFVRPNRHAVMITHRRDGSLQTSVVVAVAGREGEILVWSREPTAKTHNLARDPRTSLCIVDAEWRAWMHVDGTARVVYRPEALRLLDDYYRLRHGRDPESWEAYHAQLEADRRVMVVVTPSRVFRPSR